MMWVFSVLLVVVAAVCALIAIAASRNCVLLYEEMRRTCAALSSERGKIAAQESQLESLADQLRTLRGKFYAERRSSPNPVDSPPKSAADLKAELRKSLGLVPGRR